MIPKPVRDALGLGPVGVELSADGAALRIEPVSDDAIVEEAGRLVVPATGATIDDDVVRALRDADQR